MSFHISLVGRKNFSTEIYRQTPGAILNGLLSPGDPLPASRELARTVSVSRMTVTLAYDRLGFIIAPPSLQSAVHKAKFVSDWQAPTLAQIALAQFIEEGGFVRHIRRANAV